MSQMRAADLYYLPPVGPSIYARHQRFFKRSASKSWRVQCLLNCHTCTIEFRSSKPAGRSSHRATSPSYWSVYGSTTALHSMNWSRWCIRTCIAWRVTGWPNDTITLLDTTSNGAWSLSPPVWSEPDRCAVAPTVHRLCRADPAFGDGGFCTQAARRAVRRRKANVTLSGRPRGGFGGTDEDIERITTRSTSWRKPSRASNMWWRWSISVVSAIRRSPRLSMWPTARYGATGSARACYCRWRWKSNLHRVRIGAVTASLCLITLERQPGCDHVFFIVTFDSTRACGWRLEAPESLVGAAWVDAEQRSAWIATLEEPVPRPCSGVGATARARQLSRRDGDRRRDATLAVRRASGCIGRSPRHALKNSPFHQSVRIVCCGCSAPAAWALCGSPSAPTAWSSVRSHSSCHVPNGPIAASPTAWRASELCWHRWTIQTSRNCSMRLGERRHPYLALEYVEGEPIDSGVAASSFHRRHACGCSSTLRAPSRLHMPSSSYIGI